jgi:hypothetical protein
MTSLARAAILDCDVCHSDRENAGAMTSVPAFWSPRPAKGGARETNRIMV